MNRMKSRMQRWHVDAAGVALLIAMAAACYMLLAQPMLQSRSAARSLGAELTMKRDALARKRAARQDVEARLAEKRAAVSTQSVQLEPRSHVNQRLARLTQLAADSGVGVERLAPGLTADGPRHGTMTLKLTGKAPYHACERFVASLHDSFNDIAVTTLRLAAIPESNDPVTVDLELLWFTAPDVRASP